MVKKTEFYRLLKPSEVLKIESAIQKSDLRMSFKTAVFTGMRYKELKLFADHPEWFNFNRKKGISSISTFTYAKEIAPH